MTTIAYDRPVKDLVAQLSDTGHVTHNAYRKTSVTLHHNGGRLSHEGVLNVWRSRPASAHFDVDSVGAVAQYVKINEYAWAVGNTTGNMGTISIEMANATLEPNWTVSPVTWNSAARLAGWVFAKVIGVRPDSSNFFVHSHWSSTACAGPYINAVMSSIMAEAQGAYDFFKGHAAAPAPAPTHAPTPTRVPVPSSLPMLRIGSKGSAVSSLQRGLNRTFPAYSHLVVDGDFGNNTANVVKEFQRRVGFRGSDVDGIVGPMTRARLRECGIVV